MACELQRVDHLDFNTATFHEMGKMLTDGNDTIFIFYSCQAVAGTPNDVFRVYMRTYTASTATLGTPVQVSDDNNASASPRYNPRSPSVCRLNDGTLICVWSGTATSSPIKAAESYNNGATWTAPTTLSSTVNLCVGDIGTDGTNVWLFCHGRGNGQVHWFERIGTNAWNGYGRIFHVTGDPVASIADNSWWLGHTIGQGAYKQVVQFSASAGFFATGRYSGSAVSDEVKCFRTTNVARPQIARPNATVGTGGGNWHTEVGGTDLHNSIDDGRISSLIGGDADYVESTVGMSGAFEVHVEDVTDPGVDTGHTVYWKAKKLVAGETGGMTMLLKQGGTTIDSWITTVNNFNEFGDYLHAVPSVSVANITDYTDLRLTSTSEGGANQQIQISNLFLEVAPVTATWSEVMIEDRTGDPSVSFNPRLLQGIGGRIFAMYVLQSDDLHLAYSDDNGATWTVVGEPATTSELNWDDEQHAFCRDAVDNLFSSTIINTLPGVTDFRLYRGTVLGSDWTRIESCIFTTPFEDGATSQPADSLILGKDFYHVGGYVFEHSGAGLAENHLFILRIRGVADEGDDDEPDKPGVIIGDFMVNRIWRRGIIQSERIGLPQPGAMSAATIESLDQVGGNL